MEFECGVLGTFHISSDSFESHSFMMTGTDGTLTLGDPNSFSDNIFVRRIGARPDRENMTPGQMPKSNAGKPAEGEDDEQRLSEWVADQTVALPLLHGYSDSSRGVGLADMCYAILNGRRPRCHADIGYHAIEVIHGILESARTGKTYEMTSRCERPAPIRPSSMSSTAQEATLDD